MAKVEFGPFFDKKMKSFFRRVNVSDNGQMAQHDFEVLADRYVSLGKLSEAKAKQMRTKLDKIWNDIFKPQTTNGVLDEASFIQALKNSEDKVHESAKVFYSMWFDVMDLDDKGVITEEEFSLFLKVFRVDSKKDAQDAFKAVDKNKNGKITREEFITTGCEFSMSNDESLPSKYVFGPLI